MDSAPPVTRTRTDADHTIILTPSVESAFLRPGLRRGSWLGLAVSAVSLAGVVLWAGHQSAPAFPTGRDSVLALLGALVVYAVAIAVRGARWSQILRRAGVECRRAEPYALTVVGYMGNTVLPLRGGAVLSVVLLTDRSSAGWRESHGSIIPERLLDAAALAILLVSVTLAHGGGSPVGDAPAVLAVIILACGLAAGFGYSSLRRRGRLRSFADRVRPYVRASSILFTPIGAALLLVTLGIWLLEAVVFWLVGESLSLHFSALEALLVVVLASVSALIPAGPAYIGTYDAAILVTMRALGTASGAAISFALLVRFVIFVPITVVGLLLVLFRYGGLSQLARQAPAEQTPR